MTNNPSQKWAKDLNGHISKEDIQIANKHMKRYSASLTMRGIEIKTAVRYHFTSTRVVEIKKADNRDA